MSLQKSEYQNNIIGKNGETHSVYWFNSHINTSYDWSFSFGIKKQPVTKTIDYVHDYYQDIISRDRVMINSMRDVIQLKDKIVDNNKTNCVENQNATSIST